MYYFFFFHSYLVCPLAVKFSSNSIKIISKKKMATQQKRVLHTGISHMLYILCSWTKQRDNKLTKKKLYWIISSEIPCTTWHQTNIIVSNNKKYKFVRKETQKHLLISEIEYENEYVKREKEVNRLQQQAT